MDIEHVAAAFERYFLPSNVTESAWEICYLQADTLQVGTCTTEQKPVAPVAFLLKNFLDTEKSTWHRTLSGSSLVYYCLQQNDEQTIFDVSSNPEGSFIFTGTETETASQIPLPFPLSITCRLLLVMLRFIPGTVSDGTGQPHNQ